MRPADEHLNAYCVALSTGWSADNLRSTAAQELAEIAQDRSAFLSRMDDVEAIGPPVILPDGSAVPRLPSLRRWIWTDGFCGSIGLRWQPGTDDLPATCLGHIGYAIVPWRRREGLATAALLEMLPIASVVGLRRIDITARPENRASIGVIGKAGGRFIKTFTSPDALGAVTQALYRIEL